MLSAVISVLSTVMGTSPVFCILFGGRRACGLPLLLSPADAVRDDLGVGNSSISVKVSSIVVKSKLALSLLVDASCVVCILFVGATTGGLALLVSLVELVDDRSGD